MALAATKAEPSAGEDGRQRSRGSTASTARAVAQTGPSCQAQAATGSVKIQAVTTASSQSGPAGYVLASKVFMELASPGQGAAETTARKCTAEVDPDSAPDSAYGWAATSGVGNLG
jgi:hypothetical protein